MNKTARLISAFFLIVIAGIIGFYQIKLNTVKGSKQDYVVVVAANVFRGDEITSDKVTTKKRDIDSILKSSYKNPSDIIGKIATENFRQGEQVLSEKLTTKEQWASGEKRLVSLLNVPDKDNFTSFELRPLDVVDIYYISLSNGQQVVPQINSTNAIDGLQAILENVEVLDIKTADGMSYKDRQQGQAFVPRSALFLFPKDIASKLEKLKSQGGYFVFSIHGQRPTIDSSKKSGVEGAGAGVLFK